MAFAARVEKASINPDGQKLYTVVATYPRCIHSELLTHRDKARNSASSRAIPWKKFKKGIPPAIAIHEAESLSIPLSTFVQDLVPNCMMRMIVEDPFVPIKWGAEQTGMQTGDEIPEDKREEAKKIWLASMESQVKYADALSQLGVHKSLTNRLTEPFMWITVVITATEWKNFFRLRVHKDAEVHFQKIAGMIKEAIDAAEPEYLRYGDWHLPFISAEDKQLIIDQHLNEGRFGEKFFNKPAIEVLKYVSAGRAARVSYLTHEGLRDPIADVQLCSKLIERSDDVLHASPLEHVARSSHKDMRSGPFRGWFQMRKEFANENVEG